MSFDLTNKNIKDTFQNLLQKTGSDGRLYDLQGNPVIDLRISGSIIAEEYVVSSSVTHLTTQTLSGSTRFGDSTDDTHIFTGSVEISGSDAPADSSFSVYNGTVNFGKPQQGPSQKNPIDYVGFFGENADIYFQGIDSTKDYSYFDFPDNSRILFGTGYGPYSHDQEIYHDTGTGRFVIADLAGSNAAKGIELRARNHIVLSGSVTASGDISSSGDLLASRGTFATSITSPQIGSNETAIFTVDDNLKVNGNITASGNISSSGNLSIDSTFYAPNLDTGVDNTILILDDDGFVKTDEVDPRIFGSTLLDTDGTGTNGEIAVFTDADTVEGDANLTFSSNILSVPTIANVNTTHLTASGDISASFTSTGSFGRVETTIMSAGEGVYFSSDQQYIAPSGDDLYIGADDNLILQPDNDLLIQAGTQTFHRFFAEGKARFNSATATAPLSIVEIVGDLTLKSGGHLTASGDISASNINGVHTFGGQTIVNQITASSDISASGGKIIADTFHAASQYKFLADNIRLEEDTVGDNLKIVGGGLWASQNITASGDISSSGTLFADKIVTSQLTSSFVTSSTSILIQNITSSGDSLFGNDSDDTHTFTGDITASGNISSSGDIFADNYYLEGSKILGGGPSNNWVFGDSNFITNIGGESIVGGDAPTKFLGHITASGNISASGHISSSKIHVKSNAEIEGQITASNHILFKTPDLGGGPGIYLRTSGDINAYKIEMGDIDGNGNTTTLVLDDANEIITATQDFEITKTSEATDATGDTGALRVEGGASIAKRAYIGTQLSVGSHISSSGNISASGDLSTGGDFTQIGNGMSEPFISSSDGNVVLSGSGEASLVVNGAISASGIVNVNQLSASNGIIVDNNISASGNLISNQITASGNLRALSGSFDGGLDIGANVYLSAGHVMYFNDDKQSYVYEEGGGELRIGADSQVKVVPDTNFVFAPGGIDKAIFMPGAGGDAATPSAIKVGIGTLEPSNTLEVSGSITASNNLFIFNSASFGGADTGSATVTVQGDISASGFISASSFSGDGAGLTNVSATVPNGTISSSTQVFTAITSSGDISASGDIFGVTGSFGAEPFPQMGGLNNGYIFHVAGKITCSGNINVNSNKGIYFGGPETSFTSYIRANSTNDLSVQADENLSLKASDGNLDLKTTLQTSLRIAQDSGYVGIGLRTKPADSGKSLTVTGSMSGSGDLFIKGSGSFGLGSTTSSAAITVEGDISASKTLIIGGLSTANYVSASGGLVSASFFSGSFGGDGSGITGITATTSPAGSDTHVQFNDGGSTGGDAGFTYNKTTDSITLAGHITASGDISSSLASTVLAGSASFGYMSGSNISASGNITANGDVNVGGDIFLLDDKKIDSPNGELNVEANSHLTIKSDAGSIINHMVGDGDFQIKAGSGTPQRVLTLDSSHGYNLLLSTGSTAHHAQHKLQVSGSISASGNMGLGTNSPTIPSTLTVAGEISASGNLFLQQTASIHLNHFDSGSAVNMHTYGTAGDAQGDIVKFGGGTTAAGKMYYLATTGTWTLTDASDNTAGADELLAIALGTDPVGDGMLLRGIVRTSAIPGSDIGRAVYMDTDTGDVATTAPSSTDNIVRICGYILDGNKKQIWFNPSSTWVKIA
tara:strand:+ start:214 stop:5103 length:4890 start_codon:yes stop_codon:yes gene_type:complete